MLAFRLLYKKYMQNKIGFDLDLQSIKKNFLDELNNGMQGKKSSLPFIVHEFSNLPLVKEGEMFQVMVIGGSVYRQAKATRSDEEVLFEERRQEELPIFKTREDLFNLIERHLDTKTNLVAINFAYPMYPVLEENRLDGILISGTKEHTFNGLLGKKIGKELEANFLKKINRHIKFVVANDTVCLLLSGKGLAPKEDLACGIVGTGVNFAFFINDQKLVNLESANFDKFKASQEAVALDAKSAKPGQSIFEKETAGGYLYQHYNNIIEREKLNYPPLSSTWELKKLALGSRNEASEIAAMLIKKSASLIATQIAGITSFKKHDMTFIMEGSFFWEEDIYRNQVEECLMSLIPEYNIKFVHVEDSPFLGAAKLVI